jgi:hypothetical protein
VFWDVRSQRVSGKVEGTVASAGNRTRVTSMATMYSTTRPLMLLRFVFVASLFRGDRALGGAAWSTALRKSSMLRELFATSRSSGMAPQIWELRVTDGGFREVGGKPFSENVAHL